ncbi:outer membrane immunogenic protein [Rhizobium petrolearium]|nr:outer membrane immunogenic protein [Neorhizobium petrolearium]
MYMKRIFAALVLTIGAAGEGYAADPTVVNPPSEPPVQPVFSWTGFYLGANAGGGFAGDDKVGLHSGDVHIGDFGSVDVSGFAGGGQIGYNFQFDNNWVVGIEADFQGADISDSVTESGLHTSSKIDWYGTLRPRVGYAVDRTLFYGTGGLAYGHIDYKTSFGGVTLIDDDKTSVGWALGAGVEHAFTDHLTAKFEYQYVKFDKFDAEGDAFWTRATPDFHSIRVGLNYKF